MVRRGVRFRKDGKSQLNRKILAHGAVFRGGTRKAFFGAHVQKLQSECLIYQELLTSEAAPVSWHGCILDGANTVAQLGWLLFCLFTF